MNQPKIGVWRDKGRLEEEVAVNSLSQYRYLFPSEKQRKRNDILFFRTNFPMLYDFNPFHFGNDKVHAKIPNRLFLSSRARASSSLQMTRWAAGMIWWPRQYIVLRYRRNLFYHHRHPRYCCRYFRCCR